jgi:transposase
VKEELVYLGIDIAKSYLDGAIGNEKRRFSNDVVGHRQLIRWVKHMKLSVQVICEPSGGYERALVQALAGARIKVSLVQANGCGNLRGRRESWPRLIASTRKCCVSLAR